MQSPGFQHPESRRLIAALFIGTGYYVGAHVGVSLTFAPSPVSTFWPSNAILLAGLLLTPPRTWWMTIALVVPAHFAAEIPLGIPWANAAGGFVSNVSEALLGAAAIVGYLGRAPRFDCVRDVSLFLVVGVLVAPALSSFLDAAFVSMAGWRYTGYLEVWRVRLLSNALATLTLVPLIGIWAQRGSGLLREGSIPRAMQAAALLSGISAVSAMVFLRNYSPGFVLLSYVPLIVAESSLILLAAALSELRNARKTAEWQKERLNLALDAVAMGFWEWDLEADGITWLRDLEGSPGDGSHRPRTPARLLRLVHGDDRATVDSAMTDALSQGCSGEVDFRFSTGHGGYRWITTKGRVLADSNGKPRRVIGAYVDNTERKAQEMQLRAHREQLARLDRVSTLGELSAAIAHELNQPLNAILLNAQAALQVVRRPAPSLQVLAGILEHIVSENERASEVILRLRALLLQGTTEMVRIDVNECILEVLRLEHTDLVSHQVVTDVHLGKRIPNAVGDRVQLQQVLLNLIVNARDAMADSGTDARKLQVTSAQAEREIHVQIRDSGHGITDTEAIFEPFFSTKDHGIGMGLSICRSIITSHGGRLWASNNDPGRGATFHLCIPATQAAGPHDRPGATPAPGSGGTGP